MFKYKDLLGERNTTATANNTTNTIPLQ